MHPWLLSESETRPSSRGPGALKISDILAPESPAPPCSSIAHRLLLRHGAAHPPRPLHPPTSCAAAARRLPAVAPPPQDARRHPCLVDAARALVDAACRLLCSSPSPSPPLPPHIPRETRRQQPCLAGPTTRRASSSRMRPSRPSRRGACEPPPPPPSATRPAPPARPAQQPRYGQLPAKTASVWRAWRGEGGGGRL